MVFSTKNGHCKPEYFASFSTTRDRVLVPGPQSGLHGLQPAQALTLQCLGHGFWTHTFCSRNLGHVELAPSLGGMITLRSLYLVAFPHAFEHPDHGDHEDTTHFRGHSFLQPLGRCSTPHRYFSEAYVTWRKKRFFFTTKKGFFYKKKWFHFTT